MLSSKGMDCVGCTEKAEYVSKAFESLSMPLVEDNATKSSSEEAKGEDSSSTADKPEEKGKVDKIKKEELDDVSANTTPLIHTFLIFKSTPIHIVQKLITIHARYTVCSCMHSHIHICMHTYIRTYITVCIVNIFYGNVYMQLMAQLKKGGFGNTKMFTADDLKNMSPDEMNEKVCMYVYMYVCMYCMYVCMYSFSSTKKTL